MSEFDIEFLAQKLSENPQSPLFARLADLYLQKEQHSEALKLCEEGIRQFPKYYAGYLVLGKVCLSLKEYSTARDAFEHALEFSPFNELAAKLLADVPNQADESTRTSDKTYFVSPQDTDMVREQIAQQFAQQASQHFAGIETPTAEEMGFTHTMEELSSLPEQSLAEDNQTLMQQNPDLLMEEREEILSAPNAPSFPSFDEYFAQHSSRTQGGAVSTLDEYLAGNTSQQFQGETAVPPSETVKETIESPVVHSEPMPEKHNEPEAVFTSPEQAQLFAEMMGVEEPEIEKEKPAEKPTTTIDDLAEKLQNVERIVPQEKYQSPQKEELTSEQKPEQEPEPDTEMVTPTLAEIYAAQGEFGAAIQAYEILMFSQPGKTAEYQQRIRELQKKQMEKEGLV